MPPEDGPAEWRPGCPDCAELREELATVRAEMRAAVVSYEAKLREEVERHQALLTGLRGVFDNAAGPMDVYGWPSPPVSEATVAKLMRTDPNRKPRL